MFSKGEVKFDLWGHAQKPASNANAYVLKKSALFSCACVYMAPQTLWWDRKVAFIY